jgi:hypothetical protein
VAGVVLLGLLVLPAPLLPPHWLTEGIQSSLALGGHATYLAALIALQALVYTVLGAGAALATPRAIGRRARILQLMVVPLLVVTSAVIIRSLRLGHVPVLANAAVPLVACVAGAGLGLLIRERGWPTPLLAAVIVLGAASWALLPGATAALGDDTRIRLARLVSRAPALGPGERRFEGLVQAAFAPVTDGTASSAVEQNRAAILALGIAVGHERLARLAGLDRRSELARNAAALRSGAALGGREDWARHFSLSAALTVLGGPLVSEAGGLVKEELDAFVSGGSGFSFGDLAADRAGVRFAGAAVGSETAARAMQSRLSEGFNSSLLFPTASDLPEDLTVEDFRRHFGGVGDERYRLKVREIEALLDRCALLGR